MNISDHFYEYDGPPRAYFELVDLTYPGANVLRGRYESVYIHGPSEEACREKLDQLLLLAYRPDDDGNKEQMLFWRRRPMWTLTRADRASGTLSCRLWISNFTFGSLVEPNEADQYVWKL